MINSCHFALSTMIFKACFLSYFSNKVDGLGIPRRTVEEGEDSPAVGLLRLVHHVPEKVLVAVPTEAGGHCALDLAIELSAAAAPSLHLTQPWSYDQIQPTVLAAHHVILFFLLLCAHILMFLEKFLCSKM